MRKAGKVVQRKVPHNWRLSPQAVVTYLLGGTLENGFGVIPKYIGEQRLMEIAVVYAGIFAAVLASIPALKTQLVVFDTAVVDLTDMLADPVDVLFATQLGGGTDINQAITYCETRINRPTDTTLVLISDLYEGGNRHELMKRVAKLVKSGVNVITLLALNDDGSPAYDHNLAQHFADLGAPAFACPPDLFPDLMAAALQRADVSQWLASRGIVQG